MKSSSEVKARANKLRDTLSVMGHELKHSESLEVISKIDGYPDWNTYTAGISKQQQIAEKYLDEMLEAGLETSYAKATQRFEQAYLINFSETDLRRDLRDIHENVGEYVNREYMGSLNGASRADYAERYPDLVRHIWRGVFERGELLIIVGIYLKEGTQYVSSLNFTSH